MTPATTAPRAEPAPRDTRLSLALHEGLALPDGCMDIVRPRMGEYFTCLEKARLRLIQGFRPDHDALKMAGYDVTPAPLLEPSSPAARSVLICLPRAKAEGLDLIGQAASKPGCELVLVDGQKTDGIDSVLRQVRAHLPVAGVVSKGHGKIFWFDPRGHDLSSLRVPEMTASDPELGSFHTVPGVFSADGVDPGSAFLAQHLPPELPETVVDLGAGWGYLSAAILKRASVRQLHLVEAEASALEMARRNITDPRAVFHWADACSFTLPDRIGGIVTNPPFHTGRSPQPELGLAFIASAARLLSAKGQLWMVANRHLPYEDALNAGFSQVQILAEDRRFRIWHAAGPQGQRQARVTPDQKGRLTAKRHRRSNHR